ncbi:MAG: SDR family NAD(P)-dependent oxidoreductase [Syntrophorhabdales bacterium]|jgi:NAD(P)-dependent dehydrogenase (short-subunit alcohol dehydrogenase family)
MRFNEKVVFVTGGTKGLGKAMARAFLEEGARIVVNGRNSAAVAQFEEEFKGRAARAFEADITDYEGMERVARKVVEEWGGVDVLVNNAGIVNPLVPAEKMKKEDFDRVIDINLKGVFYTTQIVGRKMIERGSGRIISVSSQVALFGEKGFLPYAVSKAGLQVMTRNLASEWSRFGVTLCCIAPGFIRGGMNEGLVKRQHLLDFLSKKTPLGRMGSVEELVATVLFLASPEAQYINGETVVMDGGMTGYSAETLLDTITKGK